jgi:hypothetical protein
MTNRRRLAQGFAGALVLAVAAAVSLMTVNVLAHEIIVKGTVAGVEKTRIQVKTGQEKDVQPAWYPIDAATKIKRGDKVLTFDDARIKPGERVVLIVDHPDKGPMKTKEIRLATVTLPDMH